MKPQIRYHWDQLSLIDLEAFHEMKIQIHLALHNVALVGHHYSIAKAGLIPHALYWIPGLWRIAGTWVTGAKTFRSSLSLNSFELYIVDQKLNTLAQFSLSKKKFSQAMLWLEEQIGLLDLGHRALSMVLPHELDLFKNSHQYPFENIALPELKIFGSCYHNSFIVMQNFQKLYQTSQIIIWPDQLKQSIDIILKDTGQATLDTKITLGYSPGDQDINEPYFYVNSWPHAELSKLQAPPPESYWFNDVWIGAILPLNVLSKHQEQQEFLFQFYKEGLALFRTALLY